MKLTDAEPMWSWNDITYDLPEHCIDALRLVKSLLVREMRSINERRESSLYDGTGKSGEAKTAELHSARHGSSVSSSYLCQLERSRFVYIHKAHVIANELFPLLNYALLTLGEQSADRLHGEVTLSRCDSIIRGCLRALVAATTLCEVETEYDEAELQVVREESLQMLLRNASMTATTQYAVSLLLGSSPLCPDDMDFIELSLLYVKNISLLRERVKNSHEYRSTYLRSLYDSGCVDFLFVAMKQNNTSSMDCERQMRWNELISFSLAAMFKLAETPLDWISPDQPPDAALERNETQSVSTASPNRENKTLDTPVNPAPRSQSFNTELLIRRNAEGHMIRRQDLPPLARLEEIDKRKIVRTGPRKNTQAAPLYTKAIQEMSTPEHLTTQRENISELHTGFHIVRKVFSNSMLTFLQGCFQDWMLHYVPILVAWSSSADDGTEKFEEREAMMHDDACPVPVRSFFIILAAVLCAVREYGRSDSKHSQGTENHFETVELIKVTLRLIWGKITEGSKNEVQATGSIDSLEKESFDPLCKESHDDISSLNENDTEEPSVTPHHNDSTELEKGDLDRPSPISKIPYKPGTIGATALRVCTAVHLRKRQREMTLLLRFLKEYLTSMAAFPYFLPDSIAKSLIQEGKLWDGIRSWIGKRFHPRVSSEPGYLSDLLQLVYLTTIIWRRVDPEDGEMCAVLSISSDPWSLYPYELALNQWDSLSLDTIRSIKTLFYTMVHLKCHAPLVNMNFLLLYFDILMKTKECEVSSVARRTLLDNSSFAHLHTQAQSRERHELREIALQMTRITVAAIRKVGLKISLPRLIFPLSNSTWKEISTVAATSALYDDESHKTLAHAEINMSEGEAEHALKTMQSCTTTENLDVSKTQNKDKMLLKNIKNKIHPTSGKTKHRKKKKRPQNIEPIPEYGSDSLGSEVSFSLHASSARIERDHETTEKQLVSESDQF